jgi:hypothetical protein
MIREKLLLNIIMGGLTIALVGGTICAQPAVVCPNTAQPLAERWGWAGREAGERGWNRGYWVGYSIVKSMGENWFIGSCFTDSRRNRPSLCEMLGLSPCPTEREVMGPNHNLTMTGCLTIVNDRAGNVCKIPKEVGILFHLDGKKSREYFHDIKMSNLSLHVNLENEPVLWLGTADDSESVLFLQSKYTREESEDVQASIVSAVGIHQSSELVSSFLIRVVNGEDRTEVRKNAVFWLGQTNSDPALKLLLGIAETDRSEDVRGEAVFAISEMEENKGEDQLISLARTAKDPEVRKKAMFWLGQKASEKSTAALENIVNDDKDTEIQKSAVFALTQLPDEEGLDALIKIAETHQNPRVRKEAIFWLGETGNDRALNALIEILRK